MSYSYRIEQAIRAAAVLHKNQVRKGKTPFPYVTHLYAVTMIVAEYTNDENTIVAALLHDTLEDTDYTKEELNEDFGHSVLEIVESVTAASIADDESWIDSRKRFVKKLKDASQEALLICAADKIHNMRCVVEEYYDSHSQFLADFGGTLEDRILMYQEMSNVLNRNMKSDILSEFNHVFDEYKKFIESIERERLAL